MAYFERDYDESYRIEPRQRGRGYWGQFGGPIDRGYGGDYRSRGERRPEAWDTGYRYDEPFRAREYDRQYKSRWQTDYGDPYGDRVQQTPIRMIRGEPQRYGRGYDRFRGETSYPMGYMPYSRRAGYDTGYQPRRMRRYGSEYSGRYDVDWL